MVDVDRIWDRIRARAGEQFVTKTGMPFTYTVRGDYLRVVRNGRQIIGLCREPISRKPHR